MHSFVFSPGQAASAAAVDALDALIRLLARATKNRSEDSTFLTGKLSPQPAELRLLNARVTGRLPKSLRGMMCTVIPNGQQHLPVGGYHAFEGDGSLACVRIADGKASFSFRHLETEKLSAERELGRSPVLSVTAMHGASGLALIALTGLRFALLWRKYSMSTANTNVVTIGNRAFALMEQAMPYNLAVTRDGTALQCTTPLKFDAYNGPFSAHPVHHAPTNCYYAVSYTPMQKSDLTILVVNANAELVRAVPLHLGRKQMVHDAAVTDNYVVVLDLPLIISPAEMLKPDGSLLRVHHDKRARIGLFPVNATHESEMVWFDVPACFVFHAVNAYEEDGKVIIYLCQMNDFQMSNAFTHSKPDLVRYELNTITKEVVIVQEPLDFTPWFGSHPVHVDLPFCNKRFYGRKARYGYGVALVKENDGFLQFKGLWKYDFVERRLLDVIVFGEEGEAIGDAVLVEQPGAVHEDDMHIVVYVRDDEGNVSMNVHDARSMNSRPIARVHAPEGFHIPNGFHSEFIPEAKLRKMPRWDGQDEVKSTKTTPVAEQLLAGFDL